MAPKTKKSCVLKKEFWKRGGALDIQKLELESLYALGICKHIYILFKNNNQ